MAISRDGSTDLFLTSCVPYLKQDRVVTNFNCLCCEGSTGARIATIQTGTVELTSIISIQLQVSEGSKFSTNMNCRYTYNTCVLFIIAHRGTNCTVHFTPSMLEILFWFLTNKLLPISCQYTSVCIMLIV